MTDFSAQWVARWRDDIVTAVAAMTPTFEQRYGYPPGENIVRPTDADDLWGLEEYTARGVHTPEMVTFYQSLGEASLPDIGNGYFIPSARSAARHGLIFVPASDNQIGLAVGSDGGGHWFVADWSGTVWRSVAASPDADFVKVAGSIPEYLDLIRRSVLRFGQTGQVGYL